MSKNPKKTDTSSEMTPEVDGLPTAVEGNTTDAATPVVDLTRANVAEAIEKGKTLLTDGKSKADAARAIYGLLKDEPKAVIVAAFVQGATLTPKGALTYWYNCKRWAQRKARESAE